MKKGIHPSMYPVVFVDTSCGAEFVTESTIVSDQKKTINGIEQSVINVEISSASHPFYTGKQVLVDTARRVEKFQEKIRKADTVSATRKGKAVKRKKNREKKEAGAAIVGAENEKKISKKKTKKETQSK